MQHKFIDFHSHQTDQSDDSVVAFPTFRLGVDKIPQHIEKLWAGVHIWDCDKNFKFKDLIANVAERLVGIGEIGLDYHHNSNNIERQKELFCQQLEYANTNNLPVTIHCVKAHNDLLKILKEKNLKSATILHSFIGSKEMAKQFIEIGCYLSFSPLSLKSRKTIEVAKEIPIERLLLETDETKEDIKELYRYMSNIREIDIDDIIKIIEKNFKDIVE